MYRTPQARACCARDEPGEQRADPHRQGPGARHRQAVALQHVTPDGRFLYGSERKTSTLAGYRIDPGTGTLSPVGHFPTEKTPRGFNIDPRGRFLLSVRLDSHAMTVHRIKPQPGAPRAPNKIRWASSPIGSRSSICGSPAARPRGLTHPTA